MTEKNPERTKATYELVCTALDRKEMHYDRHDEDNVITLGMRTDDLPIELIIHVQDVPHVIVTLSSLPFTFSEEDRVEGAIAVTAVNNTIQNGRFDLDITDGKVTFRVAIPYYGGTNVESIDYMIGVAVVTVDKYNDLFFMLAKKVLSLENFIKKVNE